MAIFAALGVSGAIFAEPIPDSPPCKYCLGPANFAGNPPVCPINGNWSLIVAPFFWSACQDGLEFAIKNSVNVPVINATSSELQELNQLSFAHFADPYSKWDFGCKLGLKYMLECDGWDLGLIWAHFKNRSKNNIDTSVDIESLIPLWSAFSPAQGTPLYSRDSQAIWRVKLNLIDLPIGREYWTSRRLTIRPQIGLRYVRLSQNLNLENAGGSWSPRIDPIQQPFRNNILLSNAYRGLGIRAGLDSGWHCGCGFRLIGSVATSIVYGRFRITQNEENHLTIPPYRIDPVLSTEDRFRASRAVLDLLLGLEWARQFFGCTYGITTQLSWEQHLFFNQNQLWRVRRIASQQQNYPNLTGDNIYTQSRGTLDTQGWTLTLIFSF